MEAAREYLNDAEIKEDVVATLLSGKRPEGMDFEEYRIKRAAIKAFLKKRKKGRFIYISKEPGVIATEEGKKDVIKSYGPYIKTKKTI